MNPPSEQPSAEQSLPSLRIHHFMLWMAGVALALAISTQLWQPSEDLFRIIAIHLILVTIPDAIAFSTLLLILYWRLCGLPSFSEVGHWLLLAIVLITFLENTLVLTVYAYSQYVTFDWIGKVALVVHVAEKTSVGLILLVAGKRTADTSAWRRFCFIVGSIQLLSLIDPSGYPYLRFSFVFTSLPESNWFQGMVRPFAPVLGLFLVLFAMARDLQITKTRHWSHWCGVITWTIALASNTLITAYLNR